MTVDRIKAMFAQHGFTITHSKVRGKTLFKFTVTTTTTRASSIVTRVQLILQDVYSEVFITKSQPDAPPENRAALRNWKIVAAVK